MAFQINNEEWEALIGEPHKIFKAYCLIRRCVDYATGVTLNLSEDNFRRNLEVKAVPGRHKKDVISYSSITQKELRTIVERLRKIGLIEPLGKHVFRCKLATLGKSVQKSRGGAGALARAQKTGSKPATDVDSCNEQGEGNVPSRGVYQVSGKDKDITNVISKKKSLINVPDWLDAEDWECFLKHRQSLKSPMSEIAQKRAITKLESLKDKGNDIAEVLNQSIVNGWKGFFETQGASYAKHSNTGYKSKTELFYESIAGAFEPTIGGNND